MNHFHTSCKLVRELHTLIVNGQGDEEEADVIRDQINSHWDNLTASERVELWELSASLQDIAKAESSME